MLLVINCFILFFLNLKVKIKKFFFPGRETNFLSNACVPCVCIYIYIQFDSGGFECELLNGKRSIFSLQAIFLLKKKSYHDISIDDGSIVAH